MTDHDIEQAVFLAIARNPPSKQPAAVLAAIRETHALVPHQLAERAANARGSSAEAHWERGGICLELAGYAKKPGDLDED
jgi:hypothetical protein